MRRCTALLALAVVANIPALAQSANDVGAPAQNGPSLPIGKAPEGGVNCPPGGTETAAFTGATTQLGRIFRDAIPSVCPSKVYPGLFNAATTYNYEAFTYTNTSGATACVTVNFDPNTGGTPCGTNAHASAYLGSYNPANQAANFVGDVGSSITQPFSFDVPAMTDLVLVVTNTASQAICDFTWEVVNLPCTAGADLSILKVGQEVSPGVVEYDITVTNNGPADATGVVVSDTLPAQLAYVSDTCGGTGAPNWTWNVGNLLNGASAMCTITLNVVTPGAVVNTASVTANEADPNAANQSSIATLNVQGAATAIPTVDAVGLGALLALLAAAGLVMMRRRRTA